ncbi:pentatricopeptide repeat-containing protein [Tanacetum coccineum]
MWSLDHLSISVPSKGRYKTTLPSPSVIKSFIQIPRQGQETRTKNKKTIIVGEHKDHVSACLCHMLYCIQTSTPYNLAFFILKRMEKTQNKPKELLPYGMLLTTLFKHTRADQGKKRPHESNASSSSTTQNHPSSYLLLDAIVDENDDESFHFNSSSSPSQNVSSSSNVIFRVISNPPHESHHLSTHLSKTINLQTQQRDAHQEGLRPHGRMILASVEKGPLVWPSITEDGVTRLKEYVELTPAEAIQADCDIKSNKHLSPRIPTEIYALGRQTTYAAGTTRKYTLGASGSNTGKQRTVICYNCKGEGHIAKQCTKPKRKRDETWFNNKVLLVKSASGMAQDALTEVLNPDNLTYDLFNQSEQIMTSSEQSNDVSQSETEITSDSNIIPYSQYLSEAQQETVQNSNSSAQQDVMILSMFEQLTTQVTHCTNVNLEYKSANQALTTELDRYKEEVKDLKEMQNVENSFSGSNEQYAEIVHLKQNLFEQVQEKDSLMKTVFDLKNDLKWKKIEILIEKLL